MAVFDCFIFFNELDILEIRLEEMAPVVDTFVIAEARTTFQGKDKPLFFGENRGRYARFAAKIHHVVVDEWPTDDPWGRERFQRESLRRSLAGASGADTVLISDVDEILRPAAVRECVARGQFTFFDLQMSLYFINWRAGPWMKAYGAPKTVIDGMSCLSAPRETDPIHYLGVCGYEPAQIVRNAGWHFSWLGGVERMITKLDAFSHTEHDVQRWRDPALLSNQIADRRFFNDGTRLDQVPVDPTFPAFVQKKRRELERLGLLARDSRSGASQLVRLIKGGLGLGKANT